MTTSAEYCNAINIQAGHRLNAWMMAEAARKRGEAVEMCGDMVVRRPPPRGLLKTAFLAALDPEALRPQVLYTVPPICAFVP